MAASGNRKSRFLPGPTTLPITTDTLAMVSWTAQLGPLMAEHLVQLTGRSPSIVQRQLRRAVDHRLLQVEQVARILLTPEEHRSRSSCQFGSSPNLYIVTRQAIQLLRSHELIGTNTPIARTLPSPVLLRHEVLNRRFVSWFVAAARRYPDHQLSCWRIGRAAAIPAAAQSGVIVRPDAWVVYAFGRKKLAACLETDCSSERGEARWLAKVAQYESVLQADGFAAATGARYGRILVLTMTQHRRDTLTELLTKRAPDWLQERCFLGDQSLLAHSDVTAPVWRRPGQDGLLPLVPSELVKLDVGVLAHVDGDLGDLPHAQGRLAGDS